MGSKMAYHDDDGVGQRQTLLSREPTPFHQTLYYNCVSWCVCLFYIDW